MRRAIIRVVIEGFSDVTAVEVKGKIEDLLEDLDGVTVEMTLTTVPDRPSV